MKYAKKGFCRFRVIVQPEKFAESVIDEIVFIRHSLHLFTLHYELDVTIFDILSDVTSFGALRIAACFVVQRIHIFVHLM